MVGDAVVWYGVPIAAPVLDGFLPLAETVQRLSSVVVDLQCRLFKSKDKESVFGVRNDSAQDQVAPGSKPKGDSASWLIVKQ